jgi:hypothetical protein
MYVNTGHSAVKAALPPLCWASEQMEADEMLRFAQDDICAIGAVTKS